MKRVLIVTFSMMLIGISSMSFAQKAIQNNQTQQVLVQVDGLSCPFCAYGLEKKLKNIDGVASLKIDIDEGLVTLSVSGNMRPAVSCPNCAPIMAMPVPPTGPKRPACWAISVDGSQNIHTKASANFMSIFWIPTTGRFLPK